MDVKKVVEEFNNGNKKKLTDFTTKEVMLLLHKETKETITTEIKQCDSRIGALSKKLDGHIKWGEKIFDEEYGRLNEHEALLAKLVNLMPEKGWCEKVDNALFPEKDVPLASKVGQMWQMHRVMKWLGAGIGAVLIIEIGKLVL